MSNIFSNTFKALRKQHHLTQEQMAEALGVSAQAISKWETDNSCPDISLLPIIADYFGVSVDYLLGHDTGRQSEIIDNVCQETEALFQTRDYLKAIPLLRAALTRHPGNEQLMYRLAWALSGTLKECPDNYEEAILLYLKILEISTDTEMRTKVTRDLSYRYATKDNYKQALHYVNQLPSFKVCREYHLGRSNLLTGKALSNCLHSNIQLFGQAMLECLEYFADDRILSVTEKLPYTLETAQQKIMLLQKILN